MQLNQHYHTIPDDEWRSVWLPLLDEVERLRDQKSITIGIDTNYYGKWQWKQLGYIEFKSGSHLKIPGDQLDFHIVSTEQFRAVLDDIRHYAHENSIFTSKADVDEIIREFNRRERDILHAQQKADADQKQADKKFSQVALLTLFSIAGIIFTLYNMFK